MYKFSLLLFCVIFFLHAEGTDYYFSSVNGNDSNSGTDENAPKRSLLEMQKIINTLLPGDRVFLERGSVWHQASLFIVSKRGTEENPIIFDAYGHGKNPVLSGQKILSEPVRNGNVYTFTDPAIPSVYLTKYTYGRRFLGYVTIGGQPYGPSRHPNAEYYQSSSGTGVRITDLNQSWETDEWKDSWVAAKSVNWTWSVARVTTNNTYNLTTTQHNFYSPIGKKFYFFLNSANAMDQNGEWHWRDGALSIYWTHGALPPVKASVIDRIITMNESDYIHFNNIDFVGANNCCVKLTKGDYNEFDRCRFIGSGQFGISVFGIASAPPSYGDSENNQVTNSEFADCGAAAIHSRYSRGGIYKNNYIHRIGLLPGYYNEFEEGTVTDYSVVVWNNLALEPVVQQNFIDSVQAGITNHYNGSTLSIRENFVRNYGMGEMGDLGGFYVTSDPFSLSLKKRLTKNFFIDAKAPKHTMYNTNSDSYIHAVYLDQDTYGFKADSNTVENANLALKTNGGKGRTFSYNNILRPGIDLKGTIVNSYLFPLMSGSRSEADTIMHNNIVFGDGGETGYQFMRDANYGCKLPWKGQIDYNKWFDPSGNSPVVATVYQSYSLEQEFTLAQWQEFSESCLNDDLNDPGDSSSYNNTAYADVKLLKNWSDSVRYFRLSGDYVDVNGNAVGDSIAVDPFYSKHVFLLSGEDDAPDLYFDSTLVPMLSDPYVESLEPVVFYGAIVGQINFAYDQTYDEPGWTSVYGASSFPLVLESGVEISVSGGDLSSGNSGEPQTVLPAKVGSSFITTPDDVIQLTVSGLDPQKKYSFKFFASLDNNTGPGDQHIYFTAEGDTATVNATGNRTFIPELAYLQPSSSGEIVITTGKRANEDIYINAMVINEEITTSVAESAIRKNKIRYYPVPVKDHLTITNLPAECTIAVYNITGQKLLETENQKGNQMSIDMRALKPSIYIFRVRKSRQFIDSFKVTKY